MNPLSSIPSFNPAAMGLTPPAPVRTAPKILPADLQELAPAQAPASNPPDAFGNLLGKFIQGVNDKQAAATDAVTGLLSGQNIPLHQAMISMEEASVSFQLMVEVRNKLLESYQELMRMQI